MRSARSAREVRAVAPAGELLAELDQRLELVGLEHRRLVLQDRGHAVETEARVDVARRQRLEDSSPRLLGGLLVVLHEHEVPVLQEAFVLAAGQILRGSPMLERRGRHTAPSTVRTGRWARPARSSQSAGSARSARLERPSPATADRLLVGTEPSCSSPSNTVTQMSCGGEAEHLARELPGERDRLALEVVADREVAEHLKERQVPVGVADVVDVDRAKHF